MTVGSSATFTVKATGAAPLAYQWNVAGAIAPCTTTSCSVAESAAGNYPVVVTVTNSVGSVTSAIATLTVTAASNLQNATIYTTPTSLTFKGAAGSSIACQQLIGHDSSPVPPVETVVSDSAWLTVKPGSGGTPLTLSVCVNTTSLAAGTQTGHLIFTMPDQLGYHWTNSPLSDTVTLALTGVTPPPTPTAKMTCAGTAPNPIVCTIVTTNIPAGTPATVNFTIDGLSGHN